jgi:pyruvate kinase
MAYERVLMAGGTDMEARHALTNILATLGPASDDEETLARLVRAGATLFRLNFSHGTLDEHKRRLEVVRRVSYRLNRPLTVLGDLQGPKLRLGKGPDDGITLDEGQTVHVRCDREVSEGGEVPVLASDYAGLVDEVEPGHRVLINDGAVRLLAVDKADGALVCTVTAGGLVTSRKGINLPDSTLSAPAMTERDWECVAWAVENQLDYLALSFVRHAEEVAELRSRLSRMCVGDRCGSGLGLEELGSMIPVIAKIETPQAVARIESILEQADGIMVARGDLGVEIEFARVPMVQKRLIATAHAFGKPAIVATQMLESMIEHPHPTRAEVSDVANAVLDGADCVMLSGETAIGRHPVLAVDAMRRVAIALEEDLRTRPPQAKNLAWLDHDWSINQSGFSPTIQALAHGAWHMARDMKARAMVIWSQRGGGARALSRHNFHIPIIAFSSDARAVRRMNLLYAVHPVLCHDVPIHRSEFATIADRMLVEDGWVERGDPIILLGAKPLDTPGNTNTIAIRFAGELNQGDDGDE